MPRQRADTHLMIMSIYIQRCIPIGLFDGPMHSSLYRLHQEMCNWCYHARASVYRPRWVHECSDEAHGENKNLTLSLRQSVEEFIWVYAVSHGINVLGASSIMFSISAGSTLEEVWGMAWWPCHLSSPEETAPQHPESLQRHAVGTHLSVQISIPLITRTVPTHAPSVQVCARCFNATEAVWSTASYCSEDAWTGAPSEADSIALWSMWHS